MPPEDGRLTPETCRGLRHNKVIVKVIKCIKLVYQYCLTSVLYFPFSVHLLVVSNLLKKLTNVFWFYGRNFIT
jgi:hypothetical protein